MTTLEEIVANQEGWLYEKCTSESMQLIFQSLAKEIYYNLHLASFEVTNKKILEMSDMMFQKAIDLILM
jgi:hypothetical protein